jgi:hypothetical protein
MSFSRKISFSSPGFLQGKIVVDQNKRRFSTRINMIFSGSTRKRFHVSVLYVVNCHLPTTHLIMKEKKVNKSCHDARSLLA